MRSSDQRYFHVQRQKRDSREWEQWSKALILALRDVRTGQGDFAAVEAACRGGAAEWSHVLIATGRTANDFRRNFRLGSPNEHRVAVNDLAEVSDLQAVGLDGFSVLRLSKEQAKNVKLRWAKLHERDSLLHDPQGAHWSAVLGMWIDGQRAEHIEALRGLYGAGIRLVTQNMAESEEQKNQRVEKELARFMRSFADGGSDRMEIPMEWRRDTVEWHVDRLQERYAQLDAVSDSERPELRRLIENNLCIIEAFIATGSYDEAMYSTDYSGRHCSAAQLRARVIAAVDGFAKSDFGKAAQNLE